MDSLDRAMVVATTLFFILTAAYIISLSSIVSTIRFQDIRNLDSDLNNLKKYDIPFLLFAVAILLSYISLFVITFVSISKKHNPTYWAVLTAISIFIPFIALITLPTYWFAGKRTAEDAEVRKAQLAALKRGKVSVEFKGKLKKL